MTELEKALEERAEKPPKDPVRALPDHPAVTAPTRVHEIACPCCGTRATAGAACTSCGTVVA